MQKTKFLLILLLVFMIPVCGCGYTRKAMLLNDMKTIYIETVKNRLEPTEIYAYQQGLEMDITNAVIRRLQQDGTLKVVEQSKADVTLRTTLVRFEQEGLRFNQLESVEEYRLFVVVTLQLVDNRTGDTIWEEPDFMGDTEYYVTDVSSIGRQKAALEAVERLARNITDRIVEDW